MAKSGLKYPVCAKATDNGTTITYSDGMVMGKATSEKVGASASAAKIYGDDAPAEQDNSFAGGTVSVGLTDITDAARVFILGYKEGAEVDAATGAKELTTAGAEPPYVGHGFYGKVRRNGVNYWRAVWLVKVMFSDPADESTTRAEKTELAGSTLEGEILAASYDPTFWKQEATFSTEAGAIAWLNAKAGIGSGVSNNLSALTMSAGTFTPSFVAATRNYYATLSAASSTITATFAAGTAKLYIDDVYVQDLLTATASAAITVASGTPKIADIVITEAGKTPVKYTIVLYKA